MISKKDWRRFVHQMFMIQKRLDELTPPVNTSLTIDGQKVLRVDVVFDQIECQNVRANTITVYKHPDSFRNGLSLQRVKDKISMSILCHGQDGILKTMGLK